MGLDPDKSIDQYLTDRWETADGIPSNTVYCISQTPEGYLWIGTSRGLARFDGIKFKILRFARSEKRYSQEIRDLFVDRQGFLWIGGAGGLTLYRCPDCRFKNYTQADGITRDGIRHLQDDIKGNLWISFTSSYVNRFSRGEFTAYDASHGLRGKKVNAIVEDRQGNLLFGTRECGIFTYREGKFFEFPVSGLANVLIITMYEEEDGDFWIGTNRGLFKVDLPTGQSPGRFTLRDGLKSDYITSIAEDSENNLWIGTVKGLNRLGKKTAGGMRFESLAGSYIINCIFEDREKSLWIGTNDSGIIRLKDAKFMSYAPLDRYQEEIPFSLFEDPQGDIWIGTVSGRLFRSRDSGLWGPVEIPELSGTGIAAIAGDAPGDLWLGTVGRGVIHLKNDHAVRYSTREGLADNLVTSIYRDRQDNLWFSTFDGVSVFCHDDRIIESLNERTGLSGKVVHFVCEDSARNIWIAADNGITVLEKGKISRGSMEYLLPDTVVTCIYEDPSVPVDGGRVYWIATNGGGLKRLSLKNGRYGDPFSFTVDQGMTTNFIYQFLEDSHGNFWLMSDSGILRVSKSELNFLADGGLNEVNCTAFGIADGIKSLEFYNMFSRNSALKSANGEFWFITKKGISIFNPDKIRLNKTPPPVVIQAVVFDQRPVPPYPDTGAVPGQGIKEVSFLFTAPTFLSPEKIRFRYRLEGLDREWNFLHPGQERVARYRNLAPGTYTFRVTASNAEGVWNQTGAYRSITLKPFFHETLLFRIFVLLIFIAVLAGVLWFFKRHPHKTRTKYRGSHLNPHFVQECITRLKYLMEIEKVYRDADMTLQLLADKMSISPHLLSQILNEKLNRNFTDFLNSYRIAEAKKILLSPRGAQKKIAAVSREVGFNTLAGFYNVFKRYTHMTPVQFRRKGKSHR